MANTKVTQELIADDAIGAAQLASNAVVTASIADDAVTSAKLDTNLAVAGSLTVAGTLTANAGVNVDNINLDGNTLTATTDNFIIDSTHDIILDAAGSDIRLMQDGTQFGHLYNSSNDFYIASALQDKDIKLVGNDGGSTITALTLDMSDNGKAIFNGGATFASDVVITLAGNSDNLTLTTTDADATQGPNLRHYRNSSSPANDDQVGRQDYEGRNNNSQDVVYARTGTQIKDVTDGSEDGRFFINTMVAGTLYSRIDIHPTETVFNNESRDLDFRVESDNNANMLFVNGGTDKVGIGTASPTTQITASTSANITQQPLATSGTTISWNALTHANAYLVPAANLTIDNPSNSVEGAIISVEIAMNGTPRTIAWHTNFEFAASTAPTATATANKTDIFSFRYNGSVWQEIGRVQNLAQT